MDFAKSIVRVRSIKELIAFIDSLKKNFGS
jgi:hypothetical protein